MGTGYCGCHSSIGLPGIGANSTAHNTHRGSFWRTISYHKLNLLELSFFAGKIGTPGKNARGEEHLYCSEGWWLQTSLYLVTDTKSQWVGNLMSQDFRIQQTSLVTGPNVTLWAVREGQMDGPQGVLAFWIWLLLAVAIMSFNTLGLCQLLNFLSNPRSNNSCTLCNF